MTIINKILNKNQKIKYFGGKKITPEKADIKKFINNCILKYNQNVIKKAASERVMLKDAIAELEQKAKKEELTEEEKMELRRLKENLEKNIEQQKKCEDKIEKIQQKLDEAEEKIEKNQTETNDKEKNNDIDDDSINVAPNNIVNGKDKVIIQGGKQTKLSANKVSNFFSSYNIVKYHDALIEEQFADACLQRLEELENKGKKLSKSLEKEKRYYEKMFNKATAKKTKYGDILANEKGKRFKDLTELEKLELDTYYSGTEKKDLKQQEGNKVENSQKEQIQNQQKEDDEKASNFVNLDSEGRFWEKFNKLETEEEKKQMLEERRAYFANIKCAERLAQQHEDKIEEIYGTDFLSVFKKLDTKQQGEMLYNVLKQIADEQIKNQNTKQTAQPTAPAGQQPDTKTVNQNTQQVVQPTAPTVQQPDTKTVNQNTQQTAQPTAPAGQQPDTKTVNQNTQQVVQPTASTVQQPDTKTVNQNTQQTVQPTAPTVQQPDTKTVNQNTQQTVQPTAPTVQQPEVQTYETPVYNNYTFKEESLEVMYQRMINNGVSPDEASIRCEAEKKRREVVKAADENLKASTLGGNDVQAYADEVDTILREAADEEVKKEQERQRLVSSVGMTPEQLEQRDLELLGLAGESQKITSGKTR